MSVPSKISIVLAVIGSALQDTPSLPINHQPVVAKVEGVPANGITLPIVCSHERIFVRLYGMGPGDLLGVKRDGTKPTLFSLKKVNDLSNPEGLGFFVTEDSLYWLVRSEYNPRTGQVKTKRGSETRPLATTVSDLTRHIARFDKEGNYKGEVELEVDFIPGQLGVFENGSFLVAGITPGGGEAKLGLFRSNGQLDRFLTLEGDLDPNSTEAKAIVQGSSAYSRIIRTSRIISDREYLLLVRSDPKVPIFRVSAGGEVTAVKLQGVEGEIRFASSDGVNLFFAAVSSKENRYLLTGYVVDRSTGKVVSSGTFPQRTGFGLGCADGKGYSFLSVDQKTQTLQVSNFSIEE